MPANLRYEEGITVETIEPKTQDELRTVEGIGSTSLALADGLISYSERGQGYVDTLKSIIRVNKLENADAAVLRNEPRRFLIGAENAADESVAAVLVGQQPDRRRCCDSVDRDYQPVACRTGSDSD